tara:strand:- start:22762 stop:24342 length:1581 start_codon:yes stop_codon:yes gene_type:complete
MINLLALAIPIAILLIYDRVIPNGSFPTLAVLTGGVIVIVALDLILRLARLSIQTRASARIDHIARENAVRSLFTQRYPALKNITLGRFLGEMAGNNVRRERQLLIIQCLADIPFSFAFLIAIALIAGWLAAIPTIVCVLFGLIALILGVRHRNTVGKLRSGKSDKQNFVDMIFDNLGQIKTLAAEIPILHRLVRLYEVQSGNFRAQKLHSLAVSNVYSLFSQIMIGSVLITGTFAVMGGHLSYGGLAAFTLLAGRALEPMRSCYQLIVQGREPPKIPFSTLSGQHAGSRSEAMAPPEEERLFKVPPAITAQYSQSFSSSGVTAEIDLVVPARTCICISSRDSSGKSALVRGLLGLSPIKGTVRFDGNVLDATNADRIRREVTYLGRSPQLPKGAVLDVLTGGYDDRYADVRYLCHLIGLDASIRLLSEGYGTQIGNDLTKLPGGIQQQIAIVRGLACKAKVLILDDVTLSLDARTEIQLAQLLKMLKSEVTIIIMSDRPSLLAIADKHLVLENGKLTAANDRKGN